MGFGAHGSIPSTTKLVAANTRDIFEYLAKLHAAESGRFDAIVCLGCLIRGETAHFEYISSAVSHGLTEGAATTGVPMSFGVLTTNSIEEALARAAEGSANKGHEAAVAAIEMAEIVAQLTRQATPRT